MRVPITEIANGLRKTVIDNSPSILTAVAVTGVVSTALLTGKASFQAAEIIRKEEFEQTFWEEQSFQDRVRLVWKLYIPAAVTGGATIVCVIGANTVSSRRNAALISAYSLAETAFKEYKTKVVETIGVNKEQKIRDEVARERVEQDPVSTREVYITGNGDVLCYETMTGRYFQSSMETLRKAQNDINAQIINSMYASQNDFCRLIGLPSTGYGEEVGWNTSNMLDLQFSTVLSDTGKPCLAIGYSVTPVRDYYKFN